MDKMTKWNHGQTDQGNGDKCSVNLRKKLYEVRGGGLGEEKKEEAEGTKEGKCVRSRQWWW